MSDFILYPCCDSFQANCFNSIVPKYKEIWKLLQESGAGKNQMHNPTRIIPSLSCCVGFPVTLHYQICKTKGRPENKERCPSEQETWADCHNVGDVDAAQSSADASSNVCLRKRSRI